MKKIYSVGYKLVIKKGKRLLSYISTFKGEDFQFGVVQYRVKEWVYPLDGCGPLTVFTTKYDALNFFREDIKHNPIFDIKDVFLYRCKYVNKNDIGKIWIFVPILHNINRREGWTLPDGTSLASSVLLTERIFLYE